MFIIIRFGLLHSQDIPINTLRNSVFLVRTLKKLPNLIDNNQWIKNKKIKIKLR